MVLKLLTVTLLLLSSRLYGNRFTQEGEAQLQQAVQERKNYPDFVDLDLRIRWWPVYQYLIYAKVHTCELFMMLCTLSSLSFTMAANMTEMNIITLQN